MFHALRIFPLLTCLLAACGLAQSSPTTLPSAQSLYDRVTPSLVGVQFNLNYEFGRIEWVGPGVVVSSDGLILVPGDIINETFPDEQLKDFKIIIPHPDKDDEEISAEFQGRDEADNVSFVKATADKPHRWTPIKFVERPLPIGTPLYAVGMLAKTAGYHTFLNTGIVAAHIRGEIPQTLVDGGLSNIGAPVFDREGNAVGMVNSTLYDPYLSRTGGRQEISPMAPIIAPPKLFTVTHDFAANIDHPPTPTNPEKTPWVGLPQNVGLTKDVAEAFGLADQPAIQIGAVVPNSPADKAGLKVRQIIVKING
ncbi:MAG: serine protease, partial [Phycisphaerae bacterium]|nr:serine protease [Phycisphaerae bacterium]